MWYGVPYNDKYRIERIKTLQVAAINFWVVVEKKNLEAVSKNTGFS